MRTPQHPIVGAGPPGLHGPYDRWSLHEENVPGATWFPGRLRRWRSRHPDHAVVEAPAAVDHARAAGFGVEEEVEVVTDQLHLVESLVDAHGGGGMLLLPY